MQRRDLRVAAEQWRRRAGRRLPGRGWETRDATGHGPLRCVQSRRRVQPRLLDQTAAIVTGGLQRRTGLSGRRQCLHVQQHGPLPQRILADGGRRQREDRLRLPGRDRRGDQRVGHLTVQLLGLRCGRRDRRQIGEFGQRRSPPQPVRLEQVGVRGRRVVLELGLGDAQQRPRQRNIQPVAAQVEPVARRCCHQLVTGGAELASQPGDQAVQGLSARFRRLLRPQRVHQLVDRDRAALSQGEAGQHRAALEPAHIDHRTVHHQAQRPEHLDPSRPHDAQPDSPMSARARAVQAPTATVASWAAPAGHVDERTRS